MKKSIKLLTLSLLTAGMVASCGGDPGPAGPQTDWSDEQKAAMREQLYGEVLPWVDDQPELKWTSGNGYFMALGDEVEYTDLAAYAAKYTADPEDGWSLVGSTKDDTTGHVIMYTYEKKVEVEGEGERYVQAQFASVDSKYYFVENGNFLLYAEDPYYYTWNDAVIKYGIFVSDKETFDSEYITIPEIAADRYEFFDSVDEETGEPYAFLKCYTSDEKAADKFYAALSSYEDAWHVYPGQEDEDDGVFFYMADAPDGSYGIQYFYSAENKCLAVYISTSNYLYAFPQAEMNEALQKLCEEGTVPASNGDRYRFLEEYGLTIAYFDADPENPEALYSTAIHNSEWWDDAEWVESVKEYVATSKDGKASLRFYYESNAELKEDPELHGGMLIIEVGKPAFVSEFPSEAADYLGSIFYHSSITHLSADVIPDVEGASKYIFNEDNGRLGIYYESEFADGGYGALLDAAGFTVSYYSVTELGVTTYYAFSPLKSYFGVYYFGYGIRYSYSDGVLSIEFDYTDNFSYEEGQWPTQAIQEMFEVNEYTYFEVPALQSEQPERNFIADYASDDYGDYAQVFVSGASLSEITAYVNSLSETFGWEIMEGSTLDEGGASKEFIAQMGVGYIYWFMSTEEVAEEEYKYYFTLQISFSMGALEFDEFPATHVVSWFEGQGASGVKVPDFAVASESASFEVDTSYEGYFDVYVNEATAEEQAAYISQLVGKGWTVTKHDEDTGDAKLAFGDTGAYVDVKNYIEDDGYVLVSFSYVAPAQEFDEFPLTLVNAFLAEGGFGFTFADASGFTNSNESDFVYDSFEAYGGMLVVAGVSIEGDAEDGANWITKVEVSLPEGYTKDTEQSTEYQYFYTFDGGYIAVGYDADENQTFVQFAYYNF
jgi:hypothetical protein